MKFLSALVTQASGSLGGITASHNAGGQYFRSRVTPTDPSTAQQGVIRNLMANLSNLWVNVLTAAERTDWDTYAANVPLTNTLGQQINVSGLNMFTRSNIYRIQNGLGPIVAAPVVFDLGSYTAASITAAAATQLISVTFTNTDAWAAATGGALGVYASRPQNPSKNFFKGPYRLAGTILGDTTTPPTSPATVTAPFTLALGQKLFVRVNACRADGRLATQSRLATIVI